MLKQRIITASVLLPLALAGIFYLSSAGFSCVTAIILLLAAWEWGNVIGIESKIKRLGYVLLLFALLLVSIPILSWVLLGALAWWIVVLCWLYRYNQNPQVNKQLYRGLAGFFTLIPCWLSLHSLKYIYPSGCAVLALMLLVWCADIGAYFAGNHWGKRKLAPMISPGKTWAGVYGALAISILLTIVVGLSCQVNFKDGLLMLIVALLTTLFAIAGDLFESMLKRQQGIKDSGSFLPGHGGLLDRIDSLTAAAPIFAVGLWLFSSLQSSF